MPMPVETLDLSQPQETVTPTTTRTTSGSESSVCGNQENVEEAQVVSSSSLPVVKRPPIPTFKPVLQTALNPSFADPKEFATVQVIQAFDSNDMLHNKTIVLHLTHPDVTPSAVQEMVCYMINDT